MITNQLSRKKVRVNEIATAYLDTGQGEPIVALHGIPTSSLLFAGLCPHLDNYRLIAPDLLGQGQTQTPATGALDYNAYARHLQTFMDKVPPPQFHLLVHDFGGVLGLDWAGENAGRVKSLSILSTTITGSIWVGKAIYLLNLVFGQSFVRWGIQATRKRPHKLDLALIAEWVRPWSRRRILRGGDHFAGHHLKRVSGSLARLQMPTLLLWGAQDSIFPLRHASSILEALPQARLVTIQNCGHWPTLDAPRETADFLIDFLNRQIP